MALTSSPKQKVFELTAVVITGVGKFLFVDLWPYKGIYVAVACIVWIAFIIWQFIRNRTRLIEQGFTKKYFRQSFLKLLPVAIGCIVLFVAAGLIRDTIVFNLNILPVLLLYPVWGVIQQYLMMALFAGNLHELKGDRWPKSIIIAFTAIVFSIVHFPSLLLVGGTFILALIYTNHYIYRKQRNLWVLGLYHGWLACFFYYLVLGRDAWVEIMKVFQ
jgi:uncharacterized protein